MIRSATRTCKNRACRSRFTPTERHPFAIACSTGCEIILAKQHIQKVVAAREKKERKADNERKVALQPRKWWLAKAKTALHAYIRARDEGKPCISCDTILIKLGRTGGDYDAGHFRSVGSAKHLEFVENNIHGQCKRCNDYLKGNQIAYEAGLRARRGDAFVDELKADQEPRHLTIDDFKTIEATYKRKLKELRGVK